MSARKWIEFKGPTRSKSGKTRVWAVTTMEDVTIGTVSWFGRYRKYAFFPCADTVYDESCLHEIAGFLERQTKAHRAEER